MAADAAIAASVFASLSVADGATLRRDGNHRYRNRRANPSDYYYHNAPSAGIYEWRGMHAALQHHDRRRPSGAAASYEDNGFSPNLDARYGDIVDEEAEFYSKSFYERNGLRSPPLVSRRPQGRMARELDGEAGDDGRGSGDDKSSDVNRGLSENVFDAHNELQDPDTIGATRDGVDSRETDSTGVDLDEDELQLIIDAAKDGVDYPTLLRKDLLHSNYDRHAYPWDYAWFNETIKTGVPVEFSINFHKVFEVDIVSPVLDMIVWMRVEWVDPRLTWRPEEYGNLTKTWFWIGEGGAGGETSEIWTPDIELWNLEEPIRDSLTDAYAIVSHDGSVFWSRPGRLRPTCKFVGLATFPFDRLSCTLEFGSWAYTGKYIRIVPGVGNGYSVGGSKTSGSSYNEFSFAKEDPVKCIPHVYPPYPESPEEDWPVLFYDVAIDRSWQPYARGYLVTQVLLNIVGFSAFWLPPSCGERMGLSITSMLAAVASEIVVAEKLPSAAEYTWFQKFSILSMAFAFVSLIESVMVLYFFYKRSEGMSMSHGLYERWLPILRRTGTETAKHASENVKSPKSMSERAEQSNNNKIVSSSRDSFSDNKQENNVAFGNIESKARLPKNDGCDVTLDNPKSFDSETSSQKEDGLLMGGLKGLDNGEICTGKALNESAISRLSSRDLLGPMVSSNELKRNRTQVDGTKKVWIQSTSKEDSLHPAESSMRSKITSESMTTMLAEARVRQPRGVDDLIMRMK